MNYGDHIKFTLTNEDLRYDNIKFVYYYLNNLEDKYYTKKECFEEKYSLLFNIFPEEKIIIINFIIENDKPTDPDGIYGEFDVKFKFSRSYLYEDVDEDDLGTTLSIMTDEEIAFRDNHFETEDGVVKHSRYNMLRNDNNDIPIFHSYVKYFLQRNFDIIRYNIWMTAYEFYDENISYKMEYLEFYPEEIQNFICNEIDDIDDEELTEIINNKFYQIFDNPMMGG